MLIKNMKDFMPVEFLSRNGQSIAENRIESIIQIFGPNCFALCIPIRTYIGWRKAHISREVNSNAKET
jgi:hypothetical protein